MSLKYFHIFFIATTMGLMAFLAYWSLGHIPPSAARGGAVLASSAGLLLALGYLKWFINHYRTMR